MTRANTCGYAIVLVLLGGCESEPDVPPHVEIASLDDLDLGARINDMAIDRAGDLIVIGETSSPTGRLDAFIRKYDPVSGALVWERQISGPREESLTSLAVDADNSLVVAGRRDDHRLLLQRYASDGSLVSEAPSLANALAHAVTVDPGGALVVAGGRYDLLDDEQWQPAVWKWTAEASEELWAQVIEAQVPKNDLARAVAIDPDGEVLVAGSLSGQAWLGRLAGSDGALEFEFDLSIGAVEEHQQALANEAAKGRGNAMIVDGDVIYIAVTHHPGATAIMAFEADGTRRWQDLESGVIQRFARGTNEDVAAAGPNLLLCVHMQSWLGGDPNWSVVHDWITHEYTAIAVDDAGQVYLGATDGHFWSSGQTVILAAERRCLRPPRAP